MARSKASVEVEFRFPDLLGALEANKERIERTIAATVQTQVGLRFDAEGAYHGHDKWAPLKVRVGQILSKTGTMRKSISPQAADGSPGAGGFVRHTGEVYDLTSEIGTLIAYASIHNNGGVVKWPGTKNGFGRGATIPAHNITIPRRNFTDQNEQDTDELNQTVANVVADILEHAQ